MKKDYLDGLLHASYVYAYYIPGIDSIKIGFGNDAKRRMIDYCRAYNLVPEHATLVAWEMPSPVIASALETAIHRGFKQVGFDLYVLDSSEKYPQELFSLNGKTHQDATLYISQIIQEVLREFSSRFNNDHVKLENTRNKQNQLRKKREELRIENKLLKAQKQKEIEEEYKKRKLVNIERHRPFQRKFEVEISLGWEEHISPWYTLTCKAADIIREYQNPGFFTSIKFKTKNDSVLHFMNWTGYGHLVKLLPPVLETSWCALDFVSKTRASYPNFDQEYILPQSLMDKSPQNVNVCSEKPSDELVDRAFFDIFGTKFEKYNSHHQNPFNIPYLKYKQPNLVNILTELAKELPRLPDFLNFCGNPMDKSYSSSKTT